jgi:hypothetical protein
MYPTPTEAAELVTSAEAVRARVERSAPRPSRVNLGWVVFILVMIPPFDVVDPAVWGPVAGVVGGAGLVATWIYYARLTRRVRVHRSGRWLLPAMTWTIWYTGVCVLAWWLHPSVGFAYPAAAVASALPLVLLSWRLDRRGL